MPAKSRASPIRSKQRSKDPCAQWKRKLEERDAELKEALEQQKATAEILKVISSSPTILQPVFDAILENATRLCDAHMANLSLFEGNTRNLVAQCGAGAEYVKWFMNRGPVHPIAGSGWGRMIAERRPIHAADLRDSTVYRERSDPNRIALVELGGARTFLAVPMLKEGRVVGGIAIYRPEVRPFTQKQIDLVSTFANQAVIAIDNVRLFNETKEALEQQTATAEILRVISESPTDTQPVFDAVAESAARLCGAHDVVIRLVDGTMSRAVAHHGPIPVNPPQVLTRANMGSRAILDVRTVHIPDVTEARAQEEYPETWTAATGQRTFLAVPLVREDKAIGIIVMRRQEVRPFTDREIKLLETFAAQAVIAIENVRLFNETKEALEQQTVVSEILRVISSSPTDTQPVFDAIVQSGARLFGGMTVSLNLVRGDGSELVASTLPMHDTADGHSIPRDDPSYPATRAMLRRETVRVPDILAADWTNEKVRQRAGQRGWRAIMLAPMLRENDAIGTINVNRATPGPFTDKQVALLQTFADQAVIAIENVRLFKELQARNAEITEALEQQTATAEILKVISSSPTNLQPVFDAILENATRLCDAHMANLSLYDVDTRRVVAQRGGSAEYVNWATNRGPSQMPAGGPTARMIAERRPIQIADMRQSSFYRDRTLPGLVALVELGGARSEVLVPMVKEGRVVGSITIYRPEVRPFTQKQIDLVSTFANQAVIAIDNVRLFNETKEALEQQTATAEILRVISESPTDTQPVFDAVASTAARLCDASDAVILRIDGDVLRWVAHYGPFQSPAAGEGHPVNRGSTSGRAVLDRQPIHVHDLAAADNAEFPVGRALAERFGYRTALSTPLLRQGQPVGAITIRRLEVRPFSEQQIALLQTFASQAVIAIENVRLFKELQTRNAEITEALEQQTATANILRVISSSPTDIQPVLEAVAESAAQLCEAYDVNIQRVDGEVMRVAVHVGPLLTPESRPVAAKSVITRAIRELRTMHVHDVGDPRHLDEYPDAVSARRRGYRTILVAPLIREDTAIGAIAVRRAEVRPFSDKQVKLLETFAAQAVIAIENVRLFNEVKARTEELTRSVEEMRALGEVGQAVSSTLDLQTVLVTIITNAVELSKADGGGTIYEFDEATEVFEPRASHGVSDAYVQTLHELRIRIGESAVGMCAVNRNPLQVPDVENGENNRVRDTLLREGIRSVLALPLLREERVIGALVIRRKAPGTFSPTLVTLLQNFASQSVLAIENARLFQQIQTASYELRAASQHKSEFLANMSHELRTPLNAVIGFSEVLQQGMVGELNDKQGEYIEYIHKSGSHLLSLINDILDLSKVEAGRMELDLTDFNVPLAIDNALTLVKERATRHGLTLECTLDPAVADIHADERKFKQVMLNLLSNAVKFTPEGGGITVAARPVDDAVEVSVTDTGVGIAPEDCEAVFEEFRQVGTHAEGKAQGTGLGLALTKKFIELHGGRIWLTSTPGKGSTFSFTLPRGQTRTALT